MSSKDEHIFSKDALMSTHAGREIIKKAMFKSRSYNQFEYYKKYAEDSLNKFIERFATQLHDYIINDDNPKDSIDRFVKEVGSNELLLDEQKVKSIKKKLSDKNILIDRVYRITNSNFVKMTYPVFRALLDGSNKYLSLNLSEEEKDALIDGHIIAIDLSEPMDRIIDQDEDLEYLDDYRFMNPYILKIAMDKISRFGDKVLKTFEEGFKDAREGQYIDHMLKEKKITSELMDICYKKYRAIMGTAGKNMALAKDPLGEILYYGMAKAGESVGCGNEMEDSLKRGALKIPSWPLYYYSLTNDIKKAFDLTLKKSDLYLEEARLALDTLPNDFSTKPFIEFLFLTVKHYNEYWYNHTLKQLEKFKE